MLFIISQIFKEREEDLKRLSRPLECVCFRTSIWDETLYKVCTASSPYLASPLPLENESVGRRVVSCYWFASDWPLLVLQQVLVEVSCCEWHQSSPVLTNKSKTPPHVGVTVSVC